jgi:hypothetical protein
MKKKDELLLNLFAATPKTQWALRVLLHAKQQKSRGRGLAMAFDGIRNPRLALAKACSYLKFFRPAKGQDILQTIDAAINLANFMGDDVKVSFGQKLITVKPGDKRKTLLAVFDPERGKALADAKYWLGSIERDGQTEAQFVDFVREYVGKAGCTLADIGTTEEKLDTLVRKAHLNNAKYWLDSIERDGQTEAQFVDFVREYVGKADCTLADIGTSETKLEKIQRQIYRCSAQKWLGYCRTSKHRSKNMGTYVKQDASKAGCTLADIGTTENELSRLLASARF